MAEYMTMDGRGQRIMVTDENHIVTKGGIEPRMRLLYDLATKLNEVVDKKLQPRFEPVLEPVLQEEKTSMDGVVPPEQRDEPHSVVAANLDEIVDILERTSHIVDSMIDRCDL